MDYLEIDRRIRKYRREWGLSQEELAERVDISTTHMSHIETGGTKLSLPVLVGIASTLEVRTDDLLCDRASTGRQRAVEEITAALEDCTEDQARAIVEIVQAARRAMKRYL